MYVGDKYYPYYPKIRKEDIGKDTNNYFVDTFKMSNLYLDGMGGDYDGDTVTAKCPYTIEAIDELNEFMNSKANYINFSCKNSKTVGSDDVMAMFALTRVLDNKVLTKPEF